MTTRGTLAADVAVWLDRADPGDPALAAIPSFIRLAEARIARDLRVVSMQVRALQPINDVFLTLPCDWLEAIHVRLADDAGALRFVQADEAVALARGGGRPCAYTISGTQMEILPHAAAGGADPPSVEMLYWARPILGPLDSDTTPTLQSDYDVWLYASLIASAPFLDADERLPTWVSLYESARQAANDRAAQARFSASRLNARARAA